MPRNKGKVTFGGIDLGTCDVSESFLFSRPKKDEPLPSRPLLVLLDGPGDGAFFFVDDPPEIFAFLLPPLYGHPHQVWATYGLTEIYKEAGSGEGFVALYNFKY